MHEQHSRQCTAVVKNKLYSDGLISMSNFITV